MPLKVGIIGYGGMAGWHHKTINDLSELDVIGAYDIRDEVREKIHKEGLISYESGEALCSDPQIDIVIVSTPNDTHKLYSIMALRSGKNVICEKPAVMNAAELEEIIAVSKECGKVFTVNQNRRWDKDVQKIKKVLNTGILNNPYYIERRVQGSRQSLHGWRGYAVNGGGMIYDWGAHLIDQFIYLFPGNVISVDAHLQQIHSNEVDDNFSMLIRFESGLSVLINVAMNCFIKQPLWHMCCEDGTAIIYDWDSEGKIVKLNEDTSNMVWDEEIVYTAAGPTRSMAPRPKETTTEIPLPDVDVDWMDFYRNFCFAVKGTAEQAVKPEQSLRVMKIIDAAFESSRTKKSVTRVI